jgi:hypothetical protein
MIPEDISTLQYTARAVETLTKSTTHKRQWNNLTLKVTYSTKHTNIYYDSV